MPRLPSSRRDEDASGLSAPRNLNGQPQVATLPVVFLMYVDESGDTGLVGSPSNYFALSGLVVHETVWLSTLDKIIAFRRQIRTRYGLKVRRELHAAPLLNKPGDLASIAKHLRLLLLRDVLDFQATQLAGEARVINVVVDKHGKPPAYDVFDWAWRTLLTRFHNTIRHRNFPGGHTRDRGVVVADDGQEKRLRALLRRVRRYNQIPSQFNLGQSLSRPLDLLVEDPVHRDSADSFFIQLADCNAYFLHQMLRPNLYVRKKGAGNWLRRLKPILLQQAAPRDPAGLGIVRL